MKTVCTIHFNTPELTIAAIRSLWKHTQDCRVFVFDNSDQRPFVPPADASGRIKVIDNTHGKYISFESWLNNFPNREPSPGNNYGSAKHCYSVQWLIDHTDDPFILMDSDILVCRDITPLFDDRYAFVGHVGCNTRKRFGFEVLKADPFLCYLNVPMLKEHGVRYFNEEYMWNLTPVSPNNRYDTGAWLYRDVTEHCLPFLDIKVKEDYILHFGHGSWREKDYRQWLQEHSKLWQDVSVR